MSGSSSERSEENTSADVKWVEDAEGLDGDAEFEALFEEAAAGALAARPQRKILPSARAASNWVDTGPRWRKVGFTLRVVRQECNCGSVHTIVEGLFRNDEGRRNGESRMLRLVEAEELQDFSDDRESPQWVETLTQGSVMCADCAAEFGFAIPAALQPGDATPPNEWPRAEGERG